MSVHYTHTYSIQILECKENPISFVPNALHHLQGPTEKVQPCGTNREKVVILWEKKKMLEGSENPFHEQPSQLK